MSQNQRAFKKKHSFSDINHASLLQQINLRSYFMYFDLNLLAFAKTYIIRNTILLVCLEFLIL